jgi:hypothetical protein
MKNTILFTIFSLFINLTNAQGIPTYLPSNGLVAWWPFSGNAIDSSGNGNNGTVYWATISTDRLINNLTLKFKIGK